ncbi:hypothetical protein BGZ79_004606 [Entomortierella chlamydospora]|nr:hypothetical protein BGZ79_004606 [Entomortierella chlamydospora]
MSICAIIDPNQWLVSQHQTTAQYPIHALDGMEFAMAVEYAVSKTVDKNNDANSISLRKLKELVRDTSDLFFQIQGDGSMIIWGVQVLHSTNHLGKPIASVNMYSDKICNQCNRTLARSRNDCLECS